MSEVKHRDPIQGDIIHEYDGIQEADNALPSWWLYTLVGAMVFSVGYWFYYEGFKAGPGLAEAYYAERAREAEKTGRDPSDAELTAQLGTNAIAAGKQTFVSTCVPCHEASGQGKIGPNLTDKYWLHGGGSVDIFRTIRDGVPAKGMPAWGPALGRGGVMQVAAFVLSMRNSNVPGKAAEGEPYDPAAQTSDSTAH